MKTTVAELGKNKFRLSVEVPASDVGKFAERTYRRLAGEIRVPGFRPGKAPRKIIDQRLGKDFVRGEVLREALPELYASAVEESALDIVAPPEIDVKSFEDGQDLTFEAVVETRPSPELKDYLGLEVSKPSAEVTDEDVQEQLERLRTRFATLEVVERPAREGDFALVDLNTYRHDETVEELTAKDLLVEVGAEMIVPELDEELKGKRKGDILKITSTLPERFGERAGWQVGMQVLVKDVKARNLPALDDDFATTVSEFDTFVELEADIRSRIAEVKEAQASAELRERVLEAFLERGVEVDLPEGMVEMQVDELAHSFARMLAAQGATLEQYMEHEKLDGDAMRHRLRPQAERNLTLALGLDAVAEAEAIEVTPEDREKEIERIAAGIQRPLEEVTEALDERGDWSSVDGDILRAKALDLLVSRAEITAEGPPEEDQTTEGRSDT